MLLVVAETHGVEQQKEPVGVVALLSSLAGREDSERSESPPSARARAADPVEGEVQCGERQSAE